MRPVQIAALTGALAVLAWSIGGLIVNPDFATGDSATAETVLGSDMNGWHALSGFLVAIPALLLLRGNPRTLALFLLVAAGSLTATALWAFAEERPAGGCSTSRTTRWMRCSTSRFPRSSWPGRPASSGGSGATPSGLDQVAHGGLVAPAQQLDRVRLAVHDRLEERLAVLVGGQRCLRPAAHAR